MKTIGIYPGRFQPAHKGHWSVYNQLKSIAGPDTYVVTSNKVEPPESPLSFAEKQQIWVKHGVPSDHVVQVKSVYSPVELLDKFKGRNVAAIFALGEKDKQRLIGGTIKDSSGKETWLKRDGTPAYFQPYESNKNNMQPLEKHGYVIIFDDVKVDGKRISGTDIRNALGSKTHTEEQKRKFFLWAFGWFDISLFKLLTERFSKDGPNFKRNFKDEVIDIIKECLLELTGGFPTPSGTDSNVNVDVNIDANAEQRTSDSRQAKIDAQKAKEKNDRELSSKKKELEYKKKDVESLRKDQIPDLEKQKQDLNKQASTQI